MSDITEWQPQGRIFISSGKKLKIDSLEERRFIGVSEPSVQDKMHDEYLTKLAGDPYSLLVGRQGYGKNFQGKRRFSELLHGIKARVHPEDYWTPYPAFGSDEYYRRAISEKYSEKWAAILAQQNEKNVRP